MVSSMPQPHFTSGKDPCFMIHVLNIECKKMQIMNNIKFTVFWKYFVEIMTLLTDVSHGFPLSPCECSG